MTITNLLKDFSSSFPTPPILEKKGELRSLQTKNSSPELKNPYLQKAPARGTETFDNLSSEIRLNTKLAHSTAKRRYTLSELNSSINKNQYEIKEFMSGINWTLATVTGKIKKQNACGACYAYSSTAGLEALANLHRIRKPSNVFSEMQMIECSQEYLNEGCGGGMAVFVFNYVKDAGIFEETDYPVQVPYGSCRKQTGQKKDFVDLDYVVLNANVMSILKALQYGPVVANFSIDSVFKMYKSGVLDKKGCSQVPSQHSHSMLIVGYNLRSHIPYFIVRNSWGEGWGNKGYFNLEIGPLSVANKGYCNCAAKRVNAFPFLASR